MESKQPEKERFVPLITVSIDREGLKQDLYSLQSFFAPILSDFLWLIGRPKTTPKTRVNKETSRVYTPENTPENDRAEEESDVITAEWNDFDGAETIELLERCRCKNADCGIYFVPKKHNQSFCSSKCKDEYWNAKKRYQKQNQL